MTMYNKLNYDIYIFDSRNEKYEHIIKLKVFVMLLRKQS